MKQSVARFMMQTGEYKEELSINKTIFEFELELELEIEFIPHGISLSLKKL